MSKERLLRERLLHPAEEVLATASKLGRVMLTTSQGGATHERLGLVERVEGPGPGIRLLGAAHHAAIDTAILGSVILDRSGKMKDKVLPRLDFYGRDDTVLFSLVGLDGLDPFDAGLGGLMGEATDPAEPRPPGERVEVQEGDIGAIPFEAAQKAQSEITIELRREGLLQLWSGKVEAVKPAMGFINVMQPDFHLHLRAGSVHGWQVEEGAGGAGEVELLAQNAEGLPTGLVVRGPVAVLVGGERGRAVRLKNLHAPRFESVHRREPNGQSATPTASLPLAGVVNSEGVDLELKGGGRDNSLLLYRTITTPILPHLPRKGEGRPKRRASTAYPSACARKGEGGEQRRAHLR